MLIGTVCFPLAGQNKEISHEILMASARWSWDGATDTRSVTGHHSVKVVGCVRLRLDALPLWAVNKSYIKFLKFGLLRVYEIRIKSWGVGSSRV